MQVSVTLPPRLELAKVGSVAARFERLGVEVIHIAETIHDSFLVALMALQATDTVTIRTSMTVAFPRSPMIVALAARDLVAYAPERFQLGLASQVRGNIVDRFSATWDRPVAQLEDHLAAVRACFTAFDTGELDHHGTHYRLTRLQPYFRPDPAPAPELWTGAVGPAMCRLAGRACAGTVIHPTASHPVMLRNRVWPAVSAGLERRPEELGPRPRVVANPMAVTGVDDLAPELERVRHELAFLLATPAYRGVLDELGEGDRADELARAAAEKDWRRTHQLVDAELTRRLVPVATLAELPAALAERYRGLADGLVLQPPPDDDPGAEAYATALEQIREIEAAPPSVPAD